ncbi:hypothetical protein FOA52_002364 [Chlamydomonas sp. UWO 241]|nr:hypothetical protein FOA52_002364 [Chlamydomonas sp. UWO 241]
MIKSRTDRLMARAAISILSIGLLYTLYTLGAGPVYYRFVATVLRPFKDGENGFDLGDVLDDDPFTASEAQKLIQQKHNKQGGVPVAVVAAPVAVVDTPTFDVNTYPLTKERVHGLLQDGYIMVTWANHHYLDFAKSWVYNVKKIGVSGYLVGAMDDELLESLATHGINTWRMNSGITKADLGWGSQNFHKMGRSKIALIKDFLEFGVDVVITDIDTAWLRNPLPFFSRFPTADVLTSSDQLHESVKDESLESFPSAGGAFNIGIMLFRPNSMAFVNDWVEKLKDPSVWDQNCFNDLARLGHTVSKPPDNLFKGDQGKLTMGVLPVALFASGHTFFVQRKYQELGLEPYVAHATFQYSGTPGKRHRFREFMLFDDPPEYYNDPAGYVVGHIEIPQALLDAAKGVTGKMTGDKIGNHFALVHYQLARLRTLLAIATVTGRIVVLPPIWCELDKYWGPLENGNVPGTEWKKPFICPADHILEIEAHWHKKINENTFGPHIGFREYSFLSNERMQLVVKANRLVMHACPLDGGATCEYGYPQVSEVINKTMAVGTGATMAQLRDELSKHDAIRSAILEVPNDALEALHGAWKTFSPDELSKFKMRLSHLTTTFATLDGPQPGWIWYDMLADVPHTDRFGREFTDKFEYYKGEGRTKLEVPGAARRLLELPASLAAA